MARKTLRTDADGFSDALGELLGEWSADVTAGIKKAVADSTDMMVKDTKATAPKKSGFYADHIAQKTKEENSLRLVRLWYVEPPAYRMAHLLEYGHATRSGGRARAFPHIRPAFKKAEKQLIEDVRKVVADANAK